MALLGALAVTAVAGVIGVVSSEETMWRIGGTGFAAAVASLLMLRMATLLDQPATRSAGLAGAIGITIEFMLVVILTWDLSGAFPGDATEILGTAGMVGVAMVGSMAFLRLLGKPATRVASIVGLAVTATACGTGMLAVWWPPGTMNSSAFWDLVGALWGTAATVGGLGLLAVAALVGVGADRRHWRWAGVAGAAVALVLALLDIWSHAAHYEDVLAFLVAMSVWVGLAIPLLRIEVPAGQRWLRTATLVGGAATVGLWVIAVLIDFSNDTWIRAGACCAIPTACGMLAIAIIARLRRRVDTAELPRELRTITLFCPRCSRKQTQPLGAAACAACGLRIEVKAEQPACSQCGYLLYGTDAARCPECGTPVVVPARAA
jgi:DNA-directed RNA polymerase subunit RPC12/RpoP